MLIIKPSRKRLVAHTHIPLSLLVVIVLRIRVSNVPVLAKSKESLSPDSDLESLVIHHCPSAHEIAVLHYVRQTQGDGSLDLVLR